MDRYGYKGDVSYFGQNRFKAYYNGLGSVRPVLSGSGYVGAPGKVVMRGLQGVSARERDGALFASLGIQMAGPRYGAPTMGMRGLGDSRSDCQAVFSTVGALAQLGGALASLGAPSRRTGESDAAYTTRLQQWQRDNPGGQIATTVGGAAGGVGTSLCDLMFPAAGTPAPTPTNTGMSAAEIALLQQSMQAQMALAASNASAKKPMATGTKVALGAGAVAVAGIAAFFLI